METITFKHSGNAGDIIYSLPSIKMICDKQNKEAVIYIKLNQPSGFTDSQHPLGGVMMNKVMYDLLKPLLTAQSYVKDVLYFEEESVPAIDYDLDRFRVDNLNLSSGNIAQWINNSYPELRPNLYEPSIQVLDNIKAKDYIIVNRSSRYQNLFFDYSQLSKYENVYFVGVESEFKALRLHNPNIIHLQVPNFLKMAEYIDNCQLFIGNQSMAFAIAEQLKVPRILEQYAHAPNVIPQGGEYFVCHTKEQFNKAISITLDGKDFNSNPTSPEGETTTTNG
jgi:hypothetical protein